MDKRKLEHLLKTHHRDAFLWARQCCRYVDEDAKEVLQMTYLKIYEGKAKYGGKAAFRTWLFSVIRYTAIDYSKKKFSFHELQNIEDMTDGSPQTLPDTDSLDYKQLLQQLSDRQREVLILAFYHGMTLTTIAEVTGLHIGTIRTHYERGKDSLKRLIIKEKA